MTAYLVTRDIRLDQLVDALIGTAAQGAVEAVITANPGIAALGPVVPAGNRVEVPELPEPEASSTFVRVCE
ncbi:tail protein X [Azorhizobium sp. AG788]|uniref:tail protein X n=1 Tax=Azorhizobium sp. AG788 TaxID=2183897 RepID=UPI00105E52A8|nr:tail protein X [Azorhizobium sp. AG788]TDT88062.1 tail protein X [Azorhizobium sp. AG788]